MPGREEYEITLYSHCLAIVLVSIALSFANLPRTLPALQNSNPGQIAGPQIIKESCRNLCAKHSPSELCGSAIFCRSSSREKYDCLRVASLEKCVVGLSHRLFSSKFCFILIKEQICDSAAPTYRILILL